MGNGRENAIVNDTSSQSSDESFSLPAPKQSHYTPTKSDPRQISSTSSHSRNGPGGLSALPATLSQATPKASKPNYPKAPVFSAGTPTSRGAAIDKAFKDMEQGFSTKSQNKVFTPERRAVIVIDDSSDDDDGVPTDNEPTESPTKNIFNHGGRIPLSADSSQSSDNSLFSKLSLSSSQSSTEILSAPPAQPTSRSNRNEVPAFINDLFNNRQSSPTSEQSIVARPMPKSISNFATSLFGTDLKDNVIAHSDEIQQLFDTNHIEWGTQYELARGVTMGAWSWAEVGDRIKALVGSNEQIAGRVYAIMTGRPSLVDTSGIWKELDREQAAIAENKGRGLGLMGEWQGNPNWYGGQVQQLARVVKQDGSFKIVLEPMKKERSHRFARFYGSRRFVQLQIPEEVLQKENPQIKRFLIHKFVLCGRIFVPFHSKENHVYLVETSETWGRAVHNWCSDHLRMPFRDFINWHNPLSQERNYKQVISKYVTRFALGLSTSVPVLEFREENIIFIDDLTSSEWPPGKKKPPANMLMTDGCGFLNHAALHAIVKYLDYDSLPAGVQGRVDGSKGFWILHPTDQSSEPKIWIRTSQDKIKNNSFDRSHRIFDLLGPSRPSASIALTSQSIINVYANGISETALVRLLQDGLEREVGPLLEWSKPNAMVFLWNAINKLGNVSGSRTQRLSVALNRALGLRGRDWGQDSVSSNINDSITTDEELSATTYTGRNKYSGSPLGLQESVMELIQSGFHPATNPPLHTKLKSIIKTAIDASVSKYRIPIEESLGAFIVPDPIGILKEGEIYYRFSRPRKDPRTAMQVHVLEGDVLLGRYPIRLPSDMQKVKAVNIRELDKWPDVVIVSTQGKRSIASLLADGDMDGDELIVIYDPVIVEDFQNKPFTNPPADFLENNFTHGVETVEEFCHRAGLLSEREANEAFQEILIANLTESKVGLYSMMHENSALLYGYGHGHSIRLAYIFATLLDSNKSGHRLKPELLQADLKRFGKKVTNNSETAPLFGDILEILKIAGYRKGEELLQRYERIEAKDSQDKALTRPYDIAIDYSQKAYTRGASIFDEEIQRIRAHVDTAYKMWLQSISPGKRSPEFESPTKQNPKAKPKRQKKSDQDDVCLASARAYAQPLEGICLTPNLEEVKASYAYKISMPFGFSVAFQELCRIKAAAAPGGYAPNLRIFDEAKSFSSSFLRALNRCEEDAGNM